MTDTRTAILHALAKGEFLSGEQLAATLGIGRAAVWKQISQLRDLGVAIESQQGRGYRLATFEPLDATALQQAAGDCPIDVHSVLDSTNTWLLERGLEPGEQSRACLTEIQTAGRGRRGRQWLAPPGSGLCMSLAWRFEQLPASPGSLTLAVGVWVAEALASLGIQTGLKWPNDLYAVVDGVPAKLGGILVELRGELSGRATVVIGIGINHQLPKETVAELDRAVTDITQLSQSPAPGRNAVAAAILKKCLAGLPEYAHSGFAPWRDRWLALDVLRDTAVTVDGGEFNTGIARGVADDGALLIEHMGLQHRIVSGEVSLRAAS